MAEVVALRVLEGSGGAGTKDYLRALLRAYDQDCNGLIGFNDF
jgi:hypothetical protein